MKEGFWINFNTGKTVEMPEHETWIRGAQNAKRMGVSDKTFEGFKKFKPVRDRDKFLLYVLKEEPLIRVRGYGQDVTFDMATRDRARVMEAIHEFAHTYLGAFSTLNINNYGTLEHMNVMRKDFDDMVERYGFEGMAKAAAVKKRISKITMNLVRFPQQQT